MKLRLLNIAVLCLLFNSCHAGGVENQMTKMSEKNNITKCDTFDVFVSDLLSAKVEYERAVFHSDTIHLESKKKRYYSMVTNFKLNKDQNINCINQELEKKELVNSKLTQFSYYPQYSSSIPKCGHISYEVCLLLLKYNLSIPHSNKELICEDSILKKQ